MKHSNSQVLHSLVFRKLLVMASRRLKRERRSAFWSGVSGVDTEALTSEWSLETVTVASTTFVDERFTIAGRVVVVLDLWWIFVAPETDVMLEVASGICILRIVDDFWISVF